MPNVRPNLPDEFGKLDAQIANLQREVRLATSLPRAKRHLLIAKLTQMERSARDCRRTLHDGLSLRVVGRG